MKKIIFDGNTIELDDNYGCDIFPLIIGYSGETTIDELREEYEGVEIIEMDKVFYSDEPNKFHTKTCFIASLKVITDKKYEPIEVDYENDLTSIIKIIIMKDELKRTDYLKINMSGISSMKDVLDKVLKEIYVLKMTLFNEYGELYIIEFKSIDELRNYIVSIRFVQEVK